MDNMLKVRFTRFFHHFFMDRPKQPGREGWFGELEGGWKDYGYGFFEDLLVISLLFYISHPDQ